MRAHSLRLAPEKTEAVWLIGKRDTPAPNIFIEGYAVQMGQSAKYLGVHLESGLNGMAHIRAVTAKASKAAMAISRMLPRTYGASENQRRLLAAVAESITLYASPVWAKRAMRRITNRRALLATQRKMGIRISRCYRTVSTEAVLVLGRTVPWTIIVEERLEMYERAKTYNRMYDPNEEEDETRNNEEIRKESLDKWQTQWETAENGTWTRKCIPDVRPWYERDHGSLTYFTAQMLSGHGDFQTFLRRIQKVETDMCEICEEGVVDDVDHTVLRCPGLATTRGDLTAQDVPEVVQRMLQSSEEWDIVTKRVDAIMKAKTVIRREKERRRQLAAAQVAADVPRSQSSC